MYGNNENNIKYWTSPLKMEEIEKKLPMQIIKKSNTADYRVKGQIFKR